MKNLSTLTLGELLSAGNETIRRNAMAILKSLQSQCQDCGKKPKTLIYTLNGFGFCDDCWHKDITA